MNPEKPATGTSIPDLYDLLKLSAKQNDQQIIKVALREFAERVKKIQSPDEAKQAAKLFAIAKQNLLDPARKAAYDSLWDQVYGRKLVAASANEIGETAGSNTAATASQSESNSDRRSDWPQMDKFSKWDLTELNQILPPGDAQAPLDLAAFLESSDSMDGQRSTEDLDRDFQRLLQLLGGEIAISEPIALSPSAGSETSVAPPLILAASVANGVGSNSTGISQFATLPSDPVVIAASGSAAVPPPVVHKPPLIANSSRKRRKNRDVPLLVMIGGGLTVLLTVLGVLVLMLNRKDHDKEPDQVLASNQNSKSNSLPKSAARDSVRSGLPQPGSGLPQPGSGLPQPGSGLPQPEESVSTEGPMENDANNLTIPNNESVMTPAKPSPEQPTTEPPANPTLDPMPEPVPPSPTPATPAAATPLSSEPEPMVNLTDKEKSDWKVLLRSARQSIGKSDFEKARSSLEQASGLAKTSQQKSQLARLNTILPLVEQFRAAMMSAVSERTGGDVFKAGTQQISFVEANEERLVVKIQGPSNNRYKWDELPIVLAYGLADLKLDESPQSAAAKAAFAAVHGKVNGTAKEKARKLMQSAASANVIPADTHEVFDDDYSLD